MQVVEVFEVVERYCCLLWACSGRDPLEAYVWGGPEVQEGRFCGSSLEVGCVRRVVDGEGGRCKYVEVAE